MNDTKKIKINLYAKKKKNKGQEVDSAIFEEIALISDFDEFNVSLDGKKNNNYDIRVFHQRNVINYIKQNKKRINVCSIDFVPIYNKNIIKCPEFLFNIYKNYIFSFYKKADEVIISNPYFIKPLITNGITQDKITFIPKYVANERFYPLNKEETLKIRLSYKFKENEFVVLGVGSAKVSKGFDDFCKVAKKMNDVKFVWVGKKLTKPNIIYPSLLIKDEDIPSNLTFLGDIPRSEMNNLYNACDLVLLPSYQEVFPIAALESAKCLKPFIVRDLDLYKGIFFSNYIYGKDINEFVDLIYLFKEDKSKYLEAVEWSKKISYYYSKDHVAQMWRDYYLDIYKKHARKTLACSTKQ